MIAEHPLGTPSSISKTPSRSSPDQLVDVVYPTIQENTYSLCREGRLTCEEAEEVYNTLENDGIKTIDQIHFVDDDRLIKAGIPSGLVDLF